MCPKHDKALYYFCFACLDVLCVACTESHQPQHKLDTLSAAFTKCKQEVGEQLVELSDKKNKLEAYSRGLEGQVQQTKLNADEKHRELR
jgi:hypothetical protein